MNPVSSSSESCVTVFEWPPAMPARLEQLDLVEPRERIRRAQPGDAGTDDRYLHLNGDSLADHAIG